MTKLFKFLKPFSAFIAAVLGLVFIQTLTDLYLPTLMSDVIDNGVMKGDTSYIMKLGGKMLLVAAIGGACAIVASLFSSKTAVGFGRDLRNKVFNKVENLSLREFDHLGAATLVTRSTNDIMQIQMVIIITLRLMISAPLMCIGGIIMALSEDKPLTLILLVALPILSLFIILVALKGMPFFNLMQVKIDKINLVLREKLSGMRVIRAFDRIKYERQRFEDANIDVTNNYIKVNRIMAFLMPTLMLIMNLTSVAIIWFGVIRIDKGDMEMGALVAFTQYALQIMFSMLMLSMMFIMVPRAQAAAVRINQVLDTPSTINDPTQPEDSSKYNKKGYVEFRDVTFSYGNAEQPALNKISFIAEPGKVTAIIGGTGSGKSTLINLVPRFYEATSGDVLINGINVKDLTQEDLRSKIGFVPQDAILFSGTISDNIRFGKEDATEEEIRHAADIAQATDFITNLEDNFDHIISQGGTNVSGGQKQRLSIARALIRKPEIYIFDDSFSALDFKTDAKLRAALKNEITYATTIIVAQRVGTVMNADQILVLDSGNIVGIGTHKELLKTCDVYYQIVSSQLSEEEIA